MPQNKLKSNKRYILYQIYCAVTLITATWVLISLRDRHDPKIFLIPLLLIPPLLMLTSIGAFPIKYSLFGPYERSPLPPEEPLVCGSSSMVKIGWRYVRLAFQWYIFNTGLGISIWGFGKAFIPLESIKSIRSVRRDIWNSHFGLDNFDLVHDCHELRGPTISVPQKIALALQEVAHKQGRSLINE